MVCFAQPQYKENEHKILCHNDTCMTEYICPRCEYTTPSKANYRMHLLRKNPCKAVLNDVSQASLLLALDGEITERPMKLTCPYCNNDYSSRSSLHAHKLTCKQKKYKAFKANVDNINNFGGECMDHITDDSLSKCLDHDDLCIVTLIERIYFSRDAPLNNNVRVKEQSIEIYKDGYWIETDEKKIVNDMIQTAFKLLLKQCSSAPERNNERICKYFLDLLDKEENYRDLRRRVRILVRSSK